MQAHQEFKLHQFFVRMLYRKFSVDAVYQKCPKNCGMLRKKVHQTLIFTFDKAFDRFLAGLILRLKILFLGCCCWTTCFFTVFRIADLADCLDVFRFVAASKLSGKLRRNNSFPEDLTAGSNCLHINGKHFQPKA